MRAAGRDPAFDSRPSSISRPPLFNNLGSASPQILNEQQEEYLELGYCKEIQDLIPFIPSQFGSTILLGPNKISRDSDPQSAELGFLRVRDDLGRTSNDV